MLNSEPNAEHDAKPAIERVSPDAKSSTRVIQLSGHFHGSSRMFAGYRIVNNAQRKKPLVEHVHKLETNRESGRVVEKIRTIDRRDDKYREVVIDDETRKIIHECEEPLSQHKEHGSAKKKNAKLRRLSLIAGAVCVALLAGIANGKAQSGSNGFANAHLQATKAYKTLDFGDNSETVDQKMTELVGERPVETGGVGIDINDVETLCRSLFDTDAECEPYEYDSTIAQSDKFQSLMNYFNGLGLTEHFLWNSAISLDCYQLNDTVSGGGSLAAVRVRYKIFDAPKLVETFLQNYPNAHKEDKSYKCENTTYPGIFIEFKRTFFVDVEKDRRAVLSVPTGKFEFTFTEPAKLAKVQLDTWNSLMTQNNETNLSAYFESVKGSFLQLSKDIGEYQPNKRDASTYPDPNIQRMDCLTYQGWYGNGAFAIIIYGLPNAVFTSRGAFDPIVSDYIKSVAAENQKAKAQLKKEIDSSTGF